MCLVRNCKDLTIMGFKGQEDSCAYSQGHIFFGPQFNVLTAIYIQRWLLYYMDASIQFALRLHETSVFYMFSYTTPDLCQSRHSGPRSGIESSCLTPQRESPFLDQTGRFGQRLGSILDPGSSPG